MLEPKEDINERLGRSLGCGDALVLTFAYSTKRQHALAGEKRWLQNTILIHNHSYSSMVISLLSSFNFTLDEGITFIKLSFPVVNIPG